VFDAGVGNDVGAGGDVTLQSGSSNVVESGTIDLSTKKSGFDGSSGAFTGQSGDSTVGKSGDVQIQTSDQSISNGMSLTMRTGSGAQEGSDIAFTAGSSSTNAGGAVSMISGNGIAGTGIVNLQTENTGSILGTGDINVRTGKSSVKSGDIQIVFQS
jgi:hypothetical protein